MTKKHRPFNKNPNSSHEKPSLIYWSGSFKRLPKHHRLFLLVLVVPLRWKVSSYGRRYHTHQSQDQRAPELEPDRMPLP